MNAKKYFLLPIHFQDDFHAIYTQHTRLERFWPLFNSAEANPDVECNIFIFRFLFTQHQASAKICLSPCAVFFISTGEYVKCFQLKHAEGKIASLCENNSWKYLLNIASKTLSIITSSCLPFLFIRWHFLIPVFVSDAIVTVTNTERHQAPILSK